MNTFRVRIENLRLGPNPPAGMNPFCVMMHAHHMRGGTEDPNPVEVTDEGDGSWRVHDGRHRVIGALVAGRPDVLCTLKP